MSCCRRTGARLTHYGTPLDPWSRAEALVSRSRCPHRIVVPSLESTPRRRLRVTRGNIILGGVTRLNSPTAADWGALINHVWTNRTVTRELGPSTHLESRHVRCRIARSGMAPIARCPGVPGAGSATRSVTRSERRSSPSEALTSSRFQASGRPVYARRRSCGVGSCRTGSSGLNTPRRCSSVNRP
jgi:hypothetical protein